MTNRALVAMLCALMPGLAVAQPAYPPTKRVDASDNNHGHVIRDPYRWLEQTGDKDVEAWFKANATLTDQTLAKIPGRDALVKEWLELDKIRAASYSAIHVAGGRVFYKKTLGGDNVGRLYVRKGWNGAEKLLFDASTYKHGVVTTIESALASWDGKHVVLGLSSGGAEFQELRILDVTKGTLLAESFYPSYGPIGWLPDHRSFTYLAPEVMDVKSLEFELNQKTRVHVVGKPFTNDRELFSNESNPELGIEAKVFPYAWIDEKVPGHLFAAEYTVQNELHLYTAPAAQLKKPKVAWREIARTTDKLVRGFEVFGDHVYAVTYDGAPRYKVVRTSLAKPDWSAAETVVAEAKDSIQYITRSKSFLWIVYSDGVSGRLQKVDLKTLKATAVELPGKGTVGVFCPEPRSNRCVGLVTSWIAPTTLYDIDGDKGTVTKSVFDADAVYPGFDQLIVEEVEVPSHDGTLVPLSIIRRKDLKLDGTASAILEGYGAYGFSMNPHFSIMRSIALRGVVVAFAHVRGGSEKGEAWYRAGFKATKPNTWKDFIACGEYLVKNKYTSATRLAGTGTSAGGILISRAITDRPDLFAAAVCNVCMGNTVRSEFSANGPVNTPEFGTVKDPAEAKALFAMDGMHHVKPGVKYPAVLGVAGWNDPRVPPWQIGKLVATLQAASRSARPMLLKVNYDNGHFTEEKSVTYANFASQYAFLLWQTGHKDFQPTK